MLYVLLSISLFSHPVKDSLPVTDTVRIKSIRIQQASCGRFQRVISSSSSNFLLSNAAQQNGIFIKQYGIGGLATVSRRGADAAQTQILWNGIPVNNPSNGVVDFGLQSIYGAEVSMLEGSNSASFGSGAVGGIMAFDFDVDKKSGPAFSALVSRGSFQQRIVAVDAAMNAKNIGFRYQSYSLAALNNFTYNDATLNGWQNVKMKDAAIQYEMQRGIVVWQSGKWLAKAVSELVFASRGLGYTVGSALPNGTQFDKIWRNMADVKYVGKSHFGLVRIAYISEALRFDDPKRNTKEFSQSESIISQTEFGADMGKWSISTGLDILKPSAKTDGYSQPISDVFPAQFAVVKYAAKKLEISGIARYEWHERIPLYTISAQIPLINDVFLKSSIGTSFRRPTMNDLYWKPGGNLNLMAEYGRSAEVGLQYNAGKRSIKFDGFACFFVRDLNNPIVWSNSGAIWEASNLYQGKYHGAQLSMNLKWGFSTVSFFSKANYDYTFTRMELNKGEVSGKRIFVPMHTASALIGVECNQFVFSTDAQYTGLRFVTNDNSQFLPSFYLVNSECSYTPNHKPFFTFVVRGENLLHHRYENMPGRPMPGRSFQCKIIIKL